MYIKADLDICDFKDLQLRLVDLDDIMRDPTTPKITSITVAETNRLRELRKIIAEKGILEAIDYAQENNHKTLWEKTAEAALESLDFEAASRCFIKNQDFQGLQFIKRVKKMDNEKIKLAEIAAYCQKFDKAELIYLEMDRKDLALDLRMRMGDWFRVVQIIKAGSGNDHILEKAWNNIGDYYYDRQRW
jgi:WD repeat-containing protein 35